MDFLDQIVPSIRKAIADGFYSSSRYELSKIPKRSLLPTSEFSLIPVIEHRSPVEERLFDGGPEEVAKFAKSLVNAGATALSVVCERDHFDGNLQEIASAKEAGVPLLYKDFVIDPVQIEAAAHCGADAILLIQSLFDKDLTTAPIKELIDIAHQYGLETLLEVFNRDEFERAMNTNSNFIGINNRDLKTLRVDLSMTEQILQQVRPDRPVISESGVKTQADLERIEVSGAQGILVGTSILKSADPPAKLRELLGVQYVTQS